MKIEVTQDHIDRGKRHSPWTCPVALAIKDVVGHGEDVAVTPDRIRIGDGRCKTPPEVERFILKLDKGLAVRPFSFELEGHARSTEGGS